ncbi:MAG: isoprenylcysteine carboxylmethyltransferase family protein [Desulfobacteraceae bacterium]|jgi:protein-S-isoprenylcysteine O-methyltransferase Ste14
MKTLKIEPPVYLFLSIAIILLLHFLLPGTRVLPFPWNLLGIIPLVLGIVMNLVADRSFKKNETTVKPLEESTALVTDGVFRFSRHPMYLGFVLILLGIASLMGSLTPFVIVFGFAIFMHIVFMAFEEKKLEETFGEVWLEYKKKVRQWI